MSFGTTLLRSQYGELLTTPASEAQLVQNPTPTQSPPPIEIDRYCRNGQHVNPIFQNKIADAANFSVLYRTKQHFSFLGACQQQVSSSGVGDRTRWRVAFRSGPYCHGLGLVGVLMPPTAGYTNNTYARVDIYSDAALTTLVASQNLVFGNDPTNGTGGSSDYVTWRVIQSYIDGIPTDTDLYAVFTDVDYGRLHSVSLFDLQSMTEHAGGYLSTSTTTHTPVLNLHRQLPVDISNALWQKGAGNILNWSIEADAGALTRTSTTPINVVDFTSTTVTSSTPGWKIDLTNHDRANQTSGIPCTIKAFGKFSSGTGGEVILYNSGGSSVATLTGSWGTTASWKSTTFNMSPTLDKYDLMFRSTTGGTTFTLYAVSIYPYG